MGNSTIRIGSTLGQSSAVVEGNLVVDRHNHGVGPNPDSIFILKNGDGEVFKVRQDGVFIFTAKESPPDAVDGGMYFDGTDFWLSTP